AGCFNNYAYSSIADSGINAVEVREEKEQGHYIKILNKGWRVGTDGSQDNHRANWGNGSWWTMALACSLTKDEILNATRNHRTYSTLDRNLELTFWAEGHCMGETFSHADSLTFYIAVSRPDSGQNIERLELFQNGLPVSWVAIDTSNYIWRPVVFPPSGDNYYFVKVYETDGKRAWSSPIWIDCVTGLPSTPLLSSPANEDIISTPHPTFAWDPADNASSYILQYSTSNSFPVGPATVTVAGIEDNFYAVVDGLSDETWYFWRVSSANDSGSSTCSGTRSLVVDLNAMFYSDSEIKLTSHPLEDIYPSLFQGSQKTWLVWTSWRMTYSDVYYKTSSDNGENWSSAIRLTPNTAKDACPTVAQDEGGDVWVAWDSDRDSDHEIYYKIYDGISWSAASNLTNHPGSDLTPALAKTADGLMWLMWCSDREDENYEIYYKTFDGEAWSAEARLTDTDYQEKCPEIIQLDSGDLWVIWHTSEHGCFYKIHDGISWSPGMSLIDTTAYYPSITQTADGRIVLAYVIGRWLNPFRFPWGGGVYYKIYQNGEWSPEEKIAGASNSTIQWSSVAQTADGRIWVAYQRIEDGLENVYAQRTSLPDPPEAIGDLTISVEDGAKSSTGDVRLIWSRPYDDVGVERYVIYRGTDPTISGDSLAGAMDTTYVDAGAVGAPGSSYFYVVRAVDALGRKSLDSNRVGEFNSQLSNGTE
ncbi:hypothetical protein ACFL0G_04810, partial [Candidatus Zixiibacteriota bacterium]